MTQEQLKNRLLDLDTEAYVEVVDLTGTADHYQAVIVSSKFSGKSLLEQHKMVFLLVQKEVDSGEVHALSLKTYSPEQFETRQRKN